MADVKEPPVPAADPVADNRTVGTELAAAAARVIASGPYILGPEVRAFEAAFARATGTSEAIGTGSGTDASGAANAGTGAPRPGTVGPGATSSGVLHASWQFWAGFAVAALGGGLVAAAAQAGRRRRRRR